MPGANTSGGSGGGAIRAGRAFVELFLEDNKVYRALDRLKQRFQGVGAFLVKTGGIMAAAGTAVLAPLAGIFKETIGHFDDLNKAADRLGTTTEALSAMGYAAEQSGASFDDLETGLKHLQKNLSEAAHKGGEAAESFAALGLNANDLLALPIDDQLSAIADALDGMEVSADRTALAMAVLGKSGTQLLPLLKGGSGQLRDLMKEAAEVGAVVGGDDANKGTRAGDALMKAWTAVKNTLRAVATAFLPMIEGMEAAVNLAVKNLAVVRQWIADNRQLVTTVAAVAAGLVVGGAAIAAFGVAFSAIGTGIGAAIVAVKALVAAVAAAVGIIASPVGLIVAAIGGIGYVLTTQTETGRSAFASLKDGFLSVAATAKESFGGIAAALGKGDLALAGEIAMTALELLWAGAMAKFESAWAGFKSSFVEGWHEITGGVGELLHAMWDVVVEVYEGIWGVVKPVIEQIKSAWATLSDSSKAAVASIVAAFAPVAGPIMALAAMIGDSWDGMSGNIMEALNNIAAWAEKTFVRVSAIIGNAFRTIVSTILSAAIVVAENLDALDPTDQLKGTIEQAKATRAAVDASRVDPAAEIAGIEARRKALEDELRATRAKAKAEREAGREADVRAADAKAAELERKLRELNAAANAPGPGQAPEVKAAVAAAKGVAVAGVASGSKGGFDASRAAGQFGINDSISKKQLRVAEETARHTEETVKAVVALAKRLVFH